jgi:hypothetical protein
MLSFVNKEDREAICGLDDKKKAGKAGDHGIPPQILLWNFLDKMNDIRMDLLEKKKLEALPLFPSRKIFLFPVGISKPVKEKRDAFEPGDRDQSFWEHYCFSDPTLNSANTKLSADYIIILLSIEYFYALLLMSAVSKFDRKMSSRVSRSREPFGDSQ